MVILDNEKVFEPLEKYVPTLYNSVDCWKVMYMYNSGENNKIYAYKHVDTRHYIFIDEEGNFYDYNSYYNEYYEVDKVLALNYLVS